MTKFNQPNLPLSNLQLELLKLYSSGINEKYLLEIKNLISNYLLEKTMDIADKNWDEKGYNEETVNKWLSIN